MVVIPRTVEFQPGNGTRYEITMVDDPHGGILVVWPTQATYRWYPESHEWDPSNLQFLHGKLNVYDMAAIQEYLNKSFVEGFKGQFKVELI